MPAPVEYVIFPKGGHTMRAVWHEECAAKVIDKYGPFRIGKVQGTETETSEGCMHPKCEVGR